ncbi:MAG: hypothetical protein HY909_23580 [Deltaproteobacteria bacterium]|nr:hypothetical protein [Deltaproteobacteria bacterium]
MSKETQRQINELLGDFGAKLWKLFQAGVVQSVTASAPASGGRKARGGGGGGGRAAVRRSSTGRGPKSTPAEVNALITKMVDALRKHGKPMSAKDLRAAIKAEEGPFNYALNRAKDGKRVKQHGERRMARYTAGRKNARGTTPRGRGRPPGRKPRAAAAAPAAAPVTEAAVSASTESAPS